MIIRGSLSAAVPAMILALAMLAAAPPAAGAVDRLHAYFEGLEALEARFEQTRLEDGTAIERAWGTVIIQQPGKFRWSYTEPYEQLIVSDGERLWMYEPDLAQVTVRQVDAALGDTPAVLLSGGVDLEARFEIEAAPDAGGLEWVILRPRGREADFDDVRLGFDADGLARMELNDAFGQTTRLIFEDLERNPQIPEAAFEFVPPEGVDVFSD